MGNRESVQELLTASAGAEANLSGVLLEFVNFSRIFLDISAQGSGTPIPLSAGRRGACRAGPKAGEGRGAFPV